MTTMKELVAGFLAQERIAVVGVRRESPDAADAIYDKLKGKGEYQVFPVNPNAEEYKGEKCYPSVSAIPDGVDAVVMVTRPEITEEVVQDAAKAGVKHVWMHRSIGNSVSEQAVAFCKEQGISVIPGGCPMMFVEPVDFGHKCLHFIGKFAGFVPK